MVVECRADRSNRTAGKINLTDIESLFIFICPLQGEVEVLTGGKAHEPLDRTFSIQSRTSGILVPTVKVRMEEADG